MKRGMIGQVVLSLAIGCAGAIIFSETVSGTPEIAEKERLGCLVCHTGVGKPDLNDRGRYYRAERTLEGYREPESPSEPAPPERRRDPR